MEGNSTPSMLLVSSIFVTEHLYQMELFVLASFVEPEDQSASEDEDTVVIHKANLCAYWEEQESSVWWVSDIAIARGQH